MKRSVKMLIIVLASVMLILSLTSCSTDDVQLVDIIKIPDLSNVDETSAKNVLSSNGLIPKTEYIYDDNVEEGNVIKTTPGTGSEVEKNTPVTIYVSKGASYIDAKDAVMSWYNVSDKQDEWEFSNPYISEDVLYIDCNPVTFAKAIIWNDRYQKGTLFGEACINDTFDKTVPVSAVYEKQNWKANESQGFVLEIPLSDLEENRPTTMYMKLFALDSNDEQININISFSMTW